MKYTILVVLFFSTRFVSGQEAAKKTDALAGLYDRGGHIENGAVGSMLIYPETDSTILFYIDVNRGAPSYNMGTLYGRVVIKNNTGVFYTKFEYLDSGCKWNFNFSKNALKIETVDSEYGCGFGHAVYADGNYKRKSGKKPEYFEESQDGEKIYFNKITPEKYNE